MRISRGTLGLLLAGFALGAIATGALVLYTGAYNVAATTPHWWPTNWVLNTELRESVQRQARDIQAPPLDDIGMITRGFALYRQECVRCHGAPGVAPDAFALGLEPPAANLAYTARSWLPAEMYWAIKHGVKMTGMPAWEYRLGEQDLWALVAFLNRMRTMSPSEWAERVSEAQQQASLPSRERNSAVAPADAKRGKLAMSQYACTTCHIIPGVPGALSTVGPPLTEMPMRYYVAGVLPNTPDNLVRWLRDPPGVVPGTAMPALGVTEQDARDMAAYLYTLK
jgi:mono/diheme cytochrome c family protein